MLFDQQIMECPTVEMGIQCSVIVGGIDWYKYYDYYSIVVGIANIVVISQAVLYMKKLYTVVVSVVIIIMITIDRNADIHNNNNCCKNMIDNHKNYI